MFLSVMSSQGAHIPSPPRRVSLERKSILTIASSSILHQGKAEHGDMRVCTGLIKLLWFAALVGWTFRAALPGESDPGVEFAATSGDGAIIIVAALSGADRPGNPNGDPERPASPATMETICVLVEEAAQAHGLPLEFFARLIWRESRFNPGAVGPTTRNGRRAQGIAQFMPGTVKERGAFDPFDPVAALPKSAEFLRDLRVQFGNLGLAAAAYNAGAKRVRDWLAGRSKLPGQTRNYVSAVTGRSADDWAALIRRRGDGRGSAQENRSCSDLIALMKAEPVLYADAPEQRVRTATVLL